MSELELSVDAATGQEPQDQLKSNTYWFHIFQAMVDHELATLGPYAFAVYCVIKSHCDLRTGVDSFNPNHCSQSWDQSTPGYARDQNA
jgi:hypothetical protein